ncbi:hypothetical protein BP6252_01965 [Coleophoma cylindrospora]|uniref:Polysaccharide export protein n=1 Tax=Coleophoma cylindrospora TaxID=1849047 RepID=A0A3D8SDG2_9HELO|nr:hypothetical protein BP6252_01965 [Coleophoma cylindrospora]
MFFSRYQRRRITRPLILLSALLFLLDILHLTTKVSRSSSTEPPIAPEQKILIASIFRNNGRILHSHWIPSVISLIQTLGPQNVYVSIIESGSQDDTKVVLASLQTQLQALGVQHKIELGETVYEQLESVSHVPEEGKREGWIFTGRGKDRTESGWELRRIPYLARLRNKALEPLTGGKLERDGFKVQKVLWINDVVFTTKDILALLTTRSGHYAAACSLDFAHAGSTSYYDTFALRDISGSKTSSPRFPYFSSPSSLSALLNRSPIPVKSCWNGAVVFDAAPFHSSFVAGQGWKIKNGLRFRGVDDVLAREHVEGSECCLIHADNPLSEEVGKGVWINPAVRLGYNEAAYISANPGTVFSNSETEGVRKITRVDEAVRELWPGWFEVVVGTYVNRVRRWAVWLRQWSERKTVERRVARWENAVKGRQERGTFCLVNEMQVLFENGWQHVG